MWFAQTDNEITTNMVTTTMTPEETATLLGLAVGTVVYFFVSLAITIVYLIALWRIFAKAGEAGWKALIPIYNYYIILKIVGRPGWWLVLLLLPIVNIIVLLLVAVDLAKSFGKSDVFGVVAVWLFTIIGYMILGFGKANYVGPAAAKSGSSSDSQATA